MKIRMLLVAEIEVADEPEAEAKALRLIQNFGEDVNIEFSRPSFGRTFESCGCKSVEIFY